MAYHVGIDPKTNIIYAGTVNKKGDRWINKNEVTMECLGAVKEHFLWLCRGQGVNKTGFRWMTEDGKALDLTIEIIDEPNEIKQPEQEPEDGQQ